MPFLDSLDIANRAVQILGGEQIASPTEDSTRQVELTFAYDKLRRPELRRNTWRFSIRNCILRPILGFQAATATQLAQNPVMILVPPQWNTTETYTPGAIVQDLNSVFWISTADDNLNNIPGGNNEVWEAYYGPMTVSPFSSPVPASWSGATPYTQGQQVLAADGNIYAALQGSTNVNPTNNGNPTYWNNLGAPNSTNTGYYAGELVYVQAPGGSSTSPPMYQIYMSLINNNMDTPQTSTAWNSSTTYYDGQIVSYGGNYWQSLIPLNINNTPTQAPLPWDITTTYTSGNQVTAMDGFIYTATSASGNIAFNPANGLNPSYWTNTGTLGAWTASPNLWPSDIQWAPIIGCTMKLPVIPYAVGQGPTAVGNNFGRYVYRLPANFLRRVNPDPKRGQISILGAPTGYMEDDWMIEGQFLTTMNPGPIGLRFAADIIKVRDMDDLFCEGLASRLAFETCEKITGSTDKQKLAAANYGTAMADARRVNAIELSAEEAPVDDWLSTRL